MTFDLYARFHGDVACNSNRDHERGHVERDRAIEERAMRLFAARRGDWLSAVAEAARQVEAQRRMVK